MKRRRSANPTSRLTDEGIFIVLTLVIFSFAIGFPTLINTSPTIGYDQQTLQRLAPVTFAYQEAFAQQDEMQILANYYYEPNILQAYLVLPATVDMPPPDITEYFELKYNQLIEIETGFFDFEKYKQDVLDQIFPPAYAETIDDCGANCDVDDLLMKFDLNFTGVEKSVSASSACVPTGTYSYTSDSDEWEYTDSDLSGVCRQQIFSIHDQFTNYPLYLNSTNSMGSMNPSLAFIGIKHNGSPFESGNINTVTFYDLLDPDFSVNSGASAKEAYKNITLGTAREFMNTPQNIVDDDNALTQTGAHILFFERAVRDDEYTFGTVGGLSENGTRTSTQTSRASVTLDLELRWEFQFDFNNTSPLWQLKEHANSTGQTFETANVTLDTDAEKEIILSTNPTAGTGVGNFHMFKVFDKSQITDSDIIVEMSSTRIGSGDNVACIVELHDGEYRAGAEPLLADQFPDQSARIVNGSGSLGFEQLVAPFSLQNITLSSGEIDYASSTEEHLTLFITAGDNETATSVDCHVHKVIIENSPTDFSGFWNFENMDTGDQGFLLSDSGEDNENGVAISGITASEGQVPAPQPITDLNVRIKNSTEIMSGGADSTVEDVNKFFPAMMLQTFPTPTDPTLIDSFRLQIHDDSVVSGGTIGTIKGVIIGDRMGDLDFDSDISDIYFIENSTQTISTSQTYPFTQIFNFSGNTILDSNDQQVGIGILISNHTKEIRLDIDTNDGTGFNSGSALFLGNTCGSSTIFERDGCSDVTNVDLADMEIFGGTPRAFLNWTEPDDGGLSITGYSIDVANNTEIMIYGEAYFGENNAGNRTQGDHTNGEIVLGNSTDKIGHIAGQRIIFPHDFVVTTLVVTLGSNGTDLTLNGDDFQGVILKDAPVGQSGFVRVTNSSSEGELFNDSTAIELDDGQVAYLWTNIPNCCAEAVSFPPTTLTAGVEYIIGIESVNPTQPIRVFADFPQNQGHPNNGLGNFTQLNPNVSTVWWDNSTLDFNAQIFGYNFTSVTNDTGNTNTQYIDSTNRFPSLDEKINARSYSVKAINSEGSANASNYVEASPDRDLFDSWFFKEGDQRHLFNTACSVTHTTQLGASGEPTSNSLEMQFDGEAIGEGHQVFINHCFLFKSFDKDVINGSDMRFKYNLTNTGGQEPPSFIRIFDGGYDKDNSGDWIKGDGTYFTSKGSGILNTTDLITTSSDFCSGFRCDVTIPASTINYSGSVEDEITVAFVGSFSAQSNSANEPSEIQIESIQISNVGEWDFTEFPRILHQVNNGRAPATGGTNADKSVVFSQNNLAGEDDRATIVTNSFFNGTVSVSGLNATQTEEDFISVVDQEQFNVTKSITETTSATDLVVITPPTIPDPITVITGSTIDDTCQLDWTAPFNGGSVINGYRILRQVDGGGFTILVSNTSNTDTDYLDTGLVNNVLYEYDVRAGNRLGFATTSSTIVDCMPIVSDPPTAPSPLTLNEEDNGDVTLTWTEPTEGDPTGYRIERKIAPASFSTLVNDTGTTSLTYLDTTTNPSTEYTYRVAGWNSEGLGDYSNEAVITTSSAPNAPILTAQQVGDVITVNWTEPASDNPINGYKIERRINLGSFSVLIANTSSTSLSIVDSNVTKPNTYGYRVNALSVSGESPDSNIVDVVFGSHVIVQVREQDGSGFKGGGLVRAENSTFTQEVSLNANSNAIFDNFDVGNYNYTFIDNSEFILNKTFNFAFPSGNDTDSFMISALVFDVDCPANGAGSDVRIKVNYTDAKDITEFPSTPVCDSTDQVSWSTRWQGGNINDTSIMVADFISTVFKANAKTFLASAEEIPTSYSSSNNAITSDPFVVNATDVTINFNLFLGRAPSGGGTTGSSGTTAPPLTIPVTPDVEIPQRLTGFSLLSKTHQFVGAGDVIEGSLTANWEGEENLRITEIDIGDPSLDIRFELPPFELNQQLTGIGDFAMSTAEIPYTIVIPPQECNAELGISQNCFEPILHTLPVEIQFERLGVTYQGSTEVFVDGRPIPLDITQLQIILLFIVLIASAVFGRFIRNRFRKATRATKTKKKKFRKKFDSS